MTDWLEITRRNARSVQSTIGWIFFDPGAMERYQKAGLPADFAGPLGYIAARCAPLAPAGPDAVIAAFGSISPLAIRAVFQLLDEPTRFQQMWEARDAAVIEGIERHAPEAIEPLIEYGPKLWEVVEQLPCVGRTFFAAHLAMQRPNDALLSGWHAINCLREWRGDTHWAVVVGAGLTHAEASILHNAWLGYETDWLAESRGTSPDELERGWEQLSQRGLATERTVNSKGLALRQNIEDDSNRLTTMPWELLGSGLSHEFAERFEPPCVKLLKRVDVTAGTNYQPASRIHQHPK